MKKITDIDNKLMTITVDEDDKDMPTVRFMIQRLGNMTADNADDTRRIRRIVTKARDNSINEIVLENDDMNFLEKTFEKNMQKWPAWILGQILDKISGAEKVETAKV